jgi:antitoxin (DNA-binding transcriptional repressor) of toxin-antitoxin stability system
MKDVQAGEEIIIKKGDVPVAKLVPVETAAASVRPEAGQKTSEPIKLSKDAFSPLSDVELESWGL